MMNPYSTLRNVQQQNRCFLEGHDKSTTTTVKPPCSSIPLPPIRDTSALYQVNADPANPLRCHPKNDSPTHSR